MSIARYQVLITVDGVRSLMKEGQKFRVRYDLVDFTDYGRRAPRYQCVYEMADGREAILVGSRLSSLQGPEARTFSLWPGLFAHHYEFGDGRDICFGPDYQVYTCERRPDGDPSGRDD